MTRLLSLSQSNAVIRGICSEFFTLVQVPPPSADTKNPYSQVPRATLLALSGSKLTAEARGNRPLLTWLNSICPLFVTWEVNPGISVQFSPPSTVCMIFREHERLSGK